MRKSENILPKPKPPFDNNHALPTPNQKIYPTPNQKIYPNSNQKMFFQKHESCDHRQTSPFNSMSAVPEHNHDSGDFSSSSNEFDDEVKYAEQGKMTVGRLT